MDEIQLDVQIREEKGRRNVKRMRQGEYIPGVVYGGKAKKPTTIRVSRKDYEKIMRQHQGQSVLFHLNVMEEGKKLRDYAAIVKEEQLHPVKDNLLHIDFQRVSLKEEIEVEVPIALKGEAIGVKKDKGSIDQPLHELEIICLPTDIPEHIEIDITELEIGDAIHVGDIQLPQGVKTKVDAEQVLVSVVPPMKDEEEMVDEDAEPEVVGEGESPKDGEKGEGDQSAEEKAEAKPADDQEKKDG